MKNHDFFCCLDETDMDNSFQSLRKINLLNPKHFLFTLKNDFKKIPGMISDEALDLLYLSLFVFAVDRLVSRDDAEDSWSRKLHIRIPVLSIGKWKKQKVLLESILNFLSGDYWSVDFYKRKMLSYEIEAKSHFADLLFPTNQVKNICLLSGGLDSFIGAVDQLETSKDVIFVSHYGGGKGTKEYQDLLINSLSKYYKMSNGTFMQFFAAVLSGCENTQRTRSLLFFSHAIAIASSINQNTNLIVPENGFISLNIPLTHSRLGSSSTRTTHPYYMELFQTLISNLGIKVTITNPYQFKTKGEMLQNCKNLKFLNKHLNETMSCSHPDSGRMQGEKVTRHCGNCLPCVIRRAAIKRAGIKNKDNYRHITLKETKIARVNLNTYSIAIHKFNPKHAFLKIQNSGQISENILEYADLYCRGMNELKELIEEINAL